MTTYHLDLGDDRAEALGSVTKLTLVGSELDLDALLTQREAWGGAPGRRGKGADRGRGRGELPADAQGGVLLDGGRGPVGRDRHAAWRSCRAETVPRAPDPVPASAPRPGRRGATLA
nr:hypothetical protein KitaXyl93_71960 [Kitasatospora sp. Xyl93]